MVLVIIIRRDDMPDNTQKLKEYLEQFDVISDVIILNEFTESDSMIYTNIFRNYDNDFIFTINSNVVVNVIDKKLFEKYILEKDIDLLYFNKIKDQCEYQVKIDDDLRYSRNPNSVQAVMFSRRAMDYILENYDFTLDFIEYLNKIAVNSNINKLKSVVTSRNIFDTDINLIRNVYDFENLMQCDYPYKKNKLYNSGIKLFFFILIAILILVGALYLLLMTKTTN